MDGVGQRPDAAGLGVDEAGVVAHGLRGEAERALHHRLDRGPRDVLGGEVHRQGLERHPVDLGVVRVHEVLADALPELLADPLLVVLGFGQLLLVAGLDQPVEALGDHLGRQSEGVRLEGVVGVDALRVDAGPAGARLQVAAQHGLDEAADVRALQVQPVAGAVTEEAPRTLAGAGQAPDRVGLLEQAVTAWIREVIGAGQTGEPRAEDQGVHAGSARCALRHRRAVARWPESVTRIGAVGKPTPSCPFPPRFRRAMAGG